MDPLARAVGGAPASAPAMAKDDTRPRTGRLIDSEAHEAKSPDIGDLASRLRFYLPDGHIWLDTQRVALIHLSTLNALRYELIDALGLREARGFLTRMGYASGSRDAAVARKLYPQGTAGEAFLVGLRLRTLQGVAVGDPVHLELDIPTGRFLAEFVWRESYEVDGHLPVYGLSHSPVCWMQVGYLCGYASSFTGRTILFRELECRGSGSRICRVVGKPVEEWQDAETDIEPLQPEAFANRFADRTKASPNSSVVPGLVGASSGFVAACHLLKKVAKTDATVLFLGETGVGKEVFARTLHDISPRAGKPFVAINCAAIPENLVEAELFGVDRGAYTGATESRPGRFERANGGTLFLDEIGTLSLTAQTKLLRAIQQREVERVGSTSARPVDIRLVAATNVELKEAVKAGTFREDLFYRLNIFPIVIPPLRDRRADIPLLIDHFLRGFCRRHGKDVKGFTERAVSVLYEYDYPGNIRELENIIERAVIMAEGGDQPIDLCDLFAGETTPANPMLRIGRSGNLEREENAPGHDGTVFSSFLDQLLGGKISLEDMEEGLMREAVNRSKGNLSRAARLLGVTRPKLAYKLKNTKGSPL